MARRLRIQYPGAIYHLINRGNYRRDLFESVGAAQAFLRVLQQAAATYDWQVYAYVLMRNHYHLALQTPEPNLVEGMHWFQSTLATRFNRYRRENGHLFQGRYKALLVENEYALGRLVNYIHLNPVRARIVEPAAVKSYRWSSLPGLLKGADWQVLCAPWLRALGNWSDDTEGRAAYAGYLIEIGRNEARWENAGLVGLSKGWAIGTAGWRKTLAKEYGQLALQPGLHREEVAEMREGAWEAALDKMLKELGRNPGELKTKPRKKEWKLALAQRLRRETGAPIPWVANHLHLGRPATLRSYLCRLNSPNYQ